MANHSSKTSYEWEPTCAGRRRDGPRGTVSASGWIPSVTSCGRPYLLHECRPASGGIAAWGAGVCDISNAGFCRLAGHKRDGKFLGDKDFLASSRISPGASRSLSDFEDPEATEFDAAFSDQRRHNGIQRPLDDVAGVPSSTTGFFRDPFHKVALRHDFVLPRSIPQASSMLKG